MMFAELQTIPSPEVLWWALVPLLLTGGGGVILLTFASIKSNLPSWFSALWVAGISTAGFISLFPIWNRIAEEGPKTFLAGSVGVDHSSVFITGILILVVIATVALAHPYLKREDLPEVEFYVLLLLAAAGGIVMASANGLIVMFLGIEILSLATYVLAAYHLRKIQSQEAALKYFILGAFASAFLLYGIALIYGATGSTNLVEIKEWLSVNILFDDGLLLAGFAMLLAGLGFKVAAVPFHAWTPDVYQGAPSPVVGWMAAGVKAAGFAALLRVFVATFGSYVSDWSPAIAALAIASVLVGSIGAVVQTDVKRMLAYSSIAHAGFLLIGVQAATDRGTAATFTYLAIYAFLATGSFAVISLVGDQGDNQHDLEAYKGLGTRKPVLAGAFTILLLAQAGVPFTAGFIAKFGVIAAAVEARSWTPAIVAMLATAIAAFVYLRIIVSMYLSEPSEEKELSIHTGGRVVIAVSAAFTIVVGIFPSLLVDLAKDAIPILVGG